MITKILKRNQSMKLNQLVESLQEFISSDKLSQLDEILESLIEIEILERGVENSDVIKYKLIKF